MWFSFSDMISAASLNALYGGGDEQMAGISFCRGNELAFRVQVFGSGSAEQGAHRGRTPWLKVVSWEGPDAAGPVGL